MKPVRLILVHAVLLICSACTAAPIPVTPATTQTPAPSRTPTITPSPLPAETATRAASPSPAPTSTDTRIPPTPSITPAAFHAFEAHPLALSPENAASEMTRLTRIGRGKLFDAAWSPDGKYLAAATGVGVYLYDGTTLEELRLIDVNEPSTVIAFSPDGSRMAIARGAKVGIWNVETGQKLVELAEEIAGGIWALSFHGEKIAAVGQILPGLGTYEAQHRIWDSRDGRLILTEDTLCSLTYAVALDPAGRLAAVCNGFLVDLQNNERNRNIRGQFDAFFTADGRWLYSSDTDNGEPGKILRYNLQAGDAEVLADLTDCQRLERNNQAALCYGSNRLHTFDPENGQVSATLYLAEPFKTASVNPDGRRVVVVLGDDVIVWDVRTQEEIWRNNFPDFSYAALGLLQLDGTRVHAAGVFSGDEATIFDLDSGSAIQILRSDGSPFTGLAFSSDQRTLASIDEEARLMLWDLQTGERTHVFTLSDEAAAGPIRFDPDGSAVLLLTRNKNIIIRFDIRNEEIQHHPYPGWEASTRQGYLPYQFLGNGDLLTWNQSQNDDTLTLRNLTSGENVVISRAVNDELDDWLETAAHSADGQLFAAGAVQGPISIWRTDNLSDPQLLFGHGVRAGEGFTGTTIHLEFSPANNLLVSVGYDQTTRLWNIETGNPIRLLNVCCYVGFTSDGRLLVTAGEGVIRVWGIPPLP